MRSGGASSAQAVRLCGRAAVTICECRVLLHGGQRELHLKVQRVWILGGQCGELSITEGVQLVQLVQGVVVRRQWRIALRRRVGHQVAVLAVRTATTLTSVTVDRLLQFLFRGEFLFCTFVWVKVFHVPAEEKGEEEFGLEIGV